MSAETFQILNQLQLLSMRNALRDPDFSVEWERVGVMAAALLRSVLSKEAINV
jgi:hypothetical protein